MAEDVTVAEVEDWAEGLEKVLERIGPRFARSEPRVRAGVYLRGLLSTAERKNGWTLAEQAGDRTPDAMQRLLNHADWDADAVRDDLRDYVVEHLGGDAAVLVVDETGFLKKGTRSAGVVRQYSGTAGRIENCQVGVFLAYATPAGRTFIDRELYLPKAWIDDPDRCAAAGIGPEVAFATKPKLALAMLTRALDAQVPAGWVAADEIYGQHSGLRLALEGRGMSYVLAVPVSQSVFTLLDGRPVQCRADAASAAVPASAWQRLSPGPAPRGPGCMTGRGFRSGCCPNLGGTGCWSAAASPMANCPTTCASVRPSRHWPTWSRWPGPAGPSRSPSTPPRARSVSTTTRSAATTPGTGTSLWPVSRTPT